MPKKHKVRRNPLPERVETLIYKRDESTDYQKIRRLDQEIASLVHGNETDVPLTIEKKPGPSTPTTRTRGLGRKVSPATAKTQGLGHKVRTEGLGRVVEPQGGKPGPAAKSDGKAGKRSKKG